MADIVVGAVERHREDASQPHAMLVDAHLFGLDQGGGIGQHRTGPQRVEAVLFSFDNGFDGRAGALTRLSETELFLGHVGHKDRKSTRLNSSHVSISYA